jgi:signal transduction histidine kinase
MIRSLWGKFFILLLAVSAVALFAALIVRELMTRDFRDYLEGEQENRAYWLTADAERTYEKYGGWNRDAIHEDAVWALMLGFQMRIIDADGRVVADTASALASLSPRMKGRGLAAPPLTPAPPAAYVPYPLFLAGSQIGTLEVHRVEPREGMTFVKRSNRFLLLSVMAMGAVALLLSLIASRMLTRPLQELAAAAASISRGDLRSRASVEAADEIGSLAQTFNRMAQALERLEELRKKLLTNLAHELRTPLSAMRGELEGMMDGLIPTGREELKSLHDETGRLRRLLDGIEDLAHAQASVVTLAVEPVRVRPLLEHIIERAGKPTHEKQVILKLECPVDLTVDADPDKLTQIVSNVIDNAVKAVKSRGNVTVRASARDHDVALTVEDDGVGIADTDLPYIFERFYRRSEGGLGVGLAIARELVDAHGGRIDVRSEVGQGSVFTMRFPSRGTHNSS